jgi:hypothetical protein
VFKTGILAKGWGKGPILVNTLQAEPQALFEDPLHPPASASKLATTGVNRDTLYVMGWLDLSKGSLVLHVPDMAGRYYSVQFTDAAKNTNFATSAHARPARRSGTISLQGQTGEDRYRAACSRYLRRIDRSSSWAGCSWKATATLRPLMALQRRYT